MHGEQSVATFRTAWATNASWLAIKGGTPEGGHGHMDVGSFCYDAHGMRWIHDLGGDNYNMPGYFHGDRFQYYRLQNRSHNTLEIGGALQDAESEPCPIIESEPGEDAFAKFDLSAAYHQQAEKVIRTASFNSKTGAATIRDEILKPKGEVVWRVITDADCRIENDRVILSKKGKSIQLLRLSNQGQWKISDATPPQKIENANEGIQVVSLTVPAEKEVVLKIGIQP